MSYRYQLNSTCLLRFLLTLSFAVVVSAFGQPNIYCTNAVQMTLGVNYSVDTTGAPSAGISGLGCGAGLSHAVWYTFTLTNAEQVLINTAGSGYPTAFAVYTNDCGSLSNVGCANNGSINGGAFLVFNAESSVAYHILAGGFYATGGTLQITVGPGPASNDVCASAVVLSKGVTFTQDTSYAAATSDAPSGDCGAGITHAVWYTIALTNNERVVITTAGSEFTTSLALYTNNCGSLSNIACTGNGSINGGAALNLISAGNRVYHILAGNFVAGSVGGDLHILVRGILPPAITILGPTNLTERESCVQTAFPLSAQAQPGDYPITNVLFYDNTIANVVGSKTNAPYFTISSPLGFGTHVIGAQAIDSTGLTGIATNPATVLVRYPTNLHVLRADIATNGDFVGCMCAYSGSNYLVEATTNLLAPSPWPPYTTNQAIANALAFTNYPTGKQRYFRARLLP